MPTPAVIDGTTLILVVDGTAIAATTDHSMSLGVNMRDTTTKDSGGTEEVLPGTSNATLDFSGLVSYVPTFGYKELFALYVSKAKVSLKFSNEVVGDPRYVADAFLESLDKEAPTDDNTGFSGTFHITGGITEETVT